MAIANCVRVSALVFSFLAFPSAIWAQQTAETAKINLARPLPDSLSKSVLAARFQELKAQYATYKSTIEKFAPLQPSASKELTLTRSKLSAAMYSYELFETHTQKQRDRLNLLVEMNELEALRLQMSIDRLAKMIEAISSLLNKMSATGDAMI
jgi:hypothetical protein